ncbi:MAG: glycogen synthase GlgA [Deltaproteobacteria bacterium]|nr:glycogen synthase GlgA [Deltaproteobacteria bacterium]
MALNVIIASPEAIPFAKTGGLADVAGALPAALKKLGCRVALFMPLYREVRDKGFKAESTGISLNIPLGRRTITAELFRGENRGIPVYFIKRDEYFDRTYLYTTPDGDYFDNLERFTFFSRALIEAAVALNLRPDVIHCNDWQTGLVPAYIKSIYAPSFHQTATLFTIHNIAYQGLFPTSFFDVTGLPSGIYNPEGIEYWGKMNLLKSGIVYSDIVTTVSEGYSREIQTPEFGCGLDGILKKRSGSLFGVLNGVDYSEWNPETDPFIAKNYSSADLGGKSACKKDILKEYSLDITPAEPLIGIISRLADQKGFDILSEAMDEIMGLPLGMVVLGTGEKKYHQLFEKLSKKYPGKLGVKVKFDNSLAHKIEAGCDIFLMPSRYEPCGLNQMYSLRYGTIPVVRKTGGLDDTIRDYAGGAGNGFKFAEYSPPALVNKVKEALGVYNERKAWEKLEKKAMQEDFSWNMSAKRYVELYNLAVKNKRKEPVPETPFKKTAN